MRLNYLYQEVFVTEMLTIVDHKMVHCYAGSKMNFRMLPWLIQYSLSLGQLATTKYYIDRFSVASVIWYNPPFNLFQAEAFARSSVQTFS